MKRTFVQTFPSPHSVGWREEEKKFVCGTGADEGAEKPWKGCTKTCVAMAQKGEKRKMNKDNLIRLETLFESGSMISVFPFVSNCLVLQLDRGIIKALHSLARWSAHLGFRAWFDYVMLTMAKVFHRKLSPFPLGKGKKPFSRKICIFDSEKRCFRLFNW